MIRRRTTIVHATTVHTRGDTRIALKEAATAQAAFGDVALFVQDGKGDGAGPAGVRIVDTGTRPRGRLRRMTLGMWRMAWAVARERPRVAHLHDPELIPAGLWWKLHGIRVIYDVHEDLPRQILSKHWIPPLVRRPVSRAAAMAEAVAGRMFDAIITATPGIAEHFPVASCTVVQNFPDLQELTFETGPSRKDRPRNFVYVGGISAIRGVETMVRAMAELGDSTVTLNLAGAFQSESLRAEIEALDGWRRVDFVGWADREQVQDLLTSARAGLVVFHPVPNHVASQPNKLFEYMAASLPVIASDFPRWRELLDGVDCALFVDPTDPGAIAAAMRWILVHPDEAAEMGRRGRAAVRERYNWAPEARALIGTYRRLGLRFVTEAGA